MCTHTFFNNLYKTCKVTEFMYFVLNNGKTEKNKTIPKITLFKKSRKKPTCSSQLQSLIKKQNKIMYHNQISVFRSATVKRGYG